MYKEPTDCIPNIGKKNFPRLIAPSFEWLCLSCRFWHWPELWLLCIFERGSNGNLNPHAPLLNFQYSRFLWFSRSFSIMRNTCRSFKFAFEFIASFNIAYNFALQSSTFVTFVADLRYFILFLGIFFRVKCNFASAKHVGYLSTGKKE